MDKRLAERLARQDGAVSIQQALASGETPSTVARRRRNGDWCTPMPRVVHPAGLPPSFRGRLRIAQLSIGGEMAFASSTAAVLYEFPDFAVPDRLHVVVPGNRNVRSSQLVRVQRQSSLLHGTRLCGGFPVVSIEAVVAGLTPHLDFPTLVDLVQHLLNSRRTTTERLLGRTGRGVAGSACLRAAVGVAGDGHGSVWERRLAELLVAGGVVAQAQHRVVPASGAVAYLDLAFPDALLAIEIDGYVAHNRPQQFRQDRRRQNILIAELGWTVLRYTPYDIAVRPKPVVDEILAALANPR